MNRRAVSISRYSPILRFHLSSYAPTFRSPESPSFSESSRTDASYLLPEKNGGSTYISCTFPRISSFLRRCIMYSKLSPDAIFPSISTLRSALRAFSRLPSPPDAAALQTFAPAPYTSHTVKSGCCPPAEIILTDSSYCFLPSSNARRTSRIILISAAPPRGLHGRPSAAPL